MLIIRSFGQQWIINNSEFKAIYGTSIYYNNTLVCLYAFIFMNQNELMIMKVLFETKIQGHLAWPHKDSFSIHAGCGFTTGPGSK